MEYDRNIFMIGYYDPNDRMDGWGGLNAKYGVVIQHKPSGLKMMSSDTKDRYNNCEIAMRKLNALVESWSDKIKVAAFDSIFDRHNSDCDNTKDDCVKDIIKILSNANHKINGTEK
jgi:hypothetical protein